MWRLVPALPVTAFTGHLLVIAPEQRQDFSPLADLQERAIVQPRLRSLLDAEGFLARGEANPSTISSSSGFYVAACPQIIRGSCFSQ
jgi:hypothetical protein